MKRLIGIFIHENSGSSIYVLFQNSPHVNAANFGQKCFRWHVDRKNNPSKIQFCFGARVLGTSAYIQRLCKSSLLLAQGIFVVGMRQFLTVPEGAPYLEVLQSILSVDFRQSSFMSRPTVARDRMSSQVEKTNLAARLRNFIPRGISPLLSHLKPADNTSARCGTAVAVHAAAKMHQAHANPI